MIITRFCNKCQEEHFYHQYPNTILLDSGERISSAFLLLAVEYYDCEAEEEQRFLNLDKKS